MCYNGITVVAARWVIIDGLGEWLCMQVLFSVYVCLLLSLSLLYCGYCCLFSGGGVLEA